MQSAIGVVEISVLKHRAVGLEVSSVHGHGVGVRRENGWLIHVVPEAIEAV